MSKSTLRNGAGCAASRSISGALLRAVELVRREFLVLGPVSASFDGLDCAELRKQWDKWSSEAIRFMKNERRSKRSVKRLELMLKSGKRLFDGDCITCDPPAKLAAKREWEKKMSGEPVAKGTPLERYLWLEELRRHVRGLVQGWGRNLAGCRMGDLYVPDQQGCLENTSFTGGTLAVLPDSTVPWNHVRTGVAKTKGKMRVVTMQCSYVKQVLRPVHTALYDYLTGFDWLVRGDVQEEDFEAVRDDKRAGESIISGDYASATDNINVDAVEAIISVIAEAPELSDEERAVLIGSFRCVTVVQKDGSLLPIKTGSMMGNLVSFPLLCLLNKACFDMARPNHNCNSVCARIGTRGRCHRVGRFNGDDCVFCGDRLFFQKWREVTSRYGLVVQETKTGFSNIFGELNSECFDLIGGQFISKNFFSFLRPNRETPGDLLSEILSGTRGMKGSTKAWLINHVMRYEIAIRGINASTIPHKVFKILVTRRWFRKLIGSPPPPFPHTGVDRSIPVVVGTPPRGDYLDIIDLVDKEVKKAHVRYWTGRKTVESSMPIWRNLTSVTSGVIHSSLDYDNSTFNHSTSYDKTVTPYRPHLKGSLLRARKVDFDRSLPPPKHITYHRVNRWAFSYLAKTFDIMKRFFGEQFLMPTGSICGETIPYTHASLSLKWGIESLCPVGSYPPPQSLRCPLQPLESHAVRVYGLVTKNQIMLNQSKSAASKANGMICKKKLFKGFDMSLRTWE
jgi:hypothetical protein